MKQRWNGVYGKEYEFLISQADKLKERNEEKQKWIDIDSSQQRYFAHLVRNSGVSTFFPLFGGIFGHIVFSKIF